MSKRPIKLETKRLAFGLRVRKWACAPGFASAQFSYRRHPEQFVIVHRSTKPGPPWQASHFDMDIGATGDMRFRSCDEALANFSPKHWKLVAVTAERSTASLGVAKRRLTNARRRRQDR